MSNDLKKQIQFSNLSYKTTEQTLMNYFSTYGQINKLVLYKDDQDQSLRKGFLIYQNCNSSNLLMSERPHLIDKREAFLQRTMPTNFYTNNNNNCLSETLGMNLTVNELFISRLYSGERKDLFINYFQKFGTITDCRVFNSYSQNPKQMGFAFLRFNDYDSVDQIILSRPHVINSKYYHVRKSIPREYNYIVSSIKPMTSNKPFWRHYAFGLINMQTHEIRYPTLSIPEKQYGKEESTTIRKSPTHEFELVATSSLSSSISLINSSIDDFTPLQSPLYSTAIAYSPTTDII
uniref:SJCHGC06052-like protein n=1 Tax=Adineta vaga TaxID=104782 RepID=B3G4L2_ADIVA|nr:SJCHGC06052-like protein [Adineta vaga]